MKIHHPASYVARHHHLGAISADITTHGIRRWGRGEKSPTDEILGADVDERRVSGQANRHRNRNHSRGRGRRVKAARTRLRLRRDRFACVTRHTHRTIYVGDRARSARPRLGFGGRPGAVSPLRVVSGSPANPQTRRGGWHGDRPSQDSPR